MLSQRYALVLMRDVCFSPFSLSGGSLQYRQRVMRTPVGLHAAIHFHVRCILRAFRLTKSITQSCGACASHPHDTHCFCLLQLDGTNTHLLISGRNRCMAVSLIGVGLCNTSSLKWSTEVRHELLEQSPKVTRKSRQNLKSCERGNVSKAQ